MAGIAEMSDTILNFYRTPGPITQAGDHADLLRGLPNDLPALASVVQGVLLHTSHAAMYDIQSPERRIREPEMRTVREMAARIHALCDAPLVVRREPQVRLLGIGRDFAVLLTALLRHQGIPARARCGFATYFEHGQFVDHWVCEYWDAVQARWKRADAQLDGMQRDISAIWFDPFDVPNDRFLCAGRAWDLCRTGLADPHRFGVFRLNGLWFVRGNLVRDLAALNKIELLPWDAWGLIDVDEEKLTVKQLAQLDRASEITMRTCCGDFEGVQETYKQAGFRVPETIISYGRNGARQVRLAL